MTSEVKGSPPIAHTLMTREQAQQLHRLLQEAGVRLPEDLEAVLPPLDYPADADGRVAVVVRLPPRHVDYLAARARSHGEPLARHIETILREFRAHFDTRRPDHQIPPPEPGAPVLARRG